MTTRVGIAILVAPALSLAGCTSSPDPGAHWHYAVRLPADGAVLAAQLDLPAGPAERLRVEPAALPFVSEVAVEADGQVRELPLRPHGFDVPESSDSRRVRWRVDVGGAATAIDDIDVAALRANAFVGALGTFLLHPEAGRSEPFDLHVAAAGRGFGCALSATASGWAGSVGDLGASPACAFGEFVPDTLTVDGAAIEIVDLGERTPALAHAVEQWIRGATGAVADWFGAFPVAKLLLVLVPDPQRTEPTGTARGAGGARVVLDLPAPLDPDDLQRDWVLLHELLHLALPSLPPAHHWLEEGSATYVEPLLQVRMGRITEAEVWRAMLDDYGQGLATADRGGLDDDDSWGRTYYGGAIFCLMADVEIRRLTDNRRSLRDALAAVVAAGGSITTGWTIGQVLEVGDAATSTSVLRDLYAAMRHAASPRELDTLWRRLGVRVERDRIVFDDTAPLAAVRQRLLRGP